MAVERVEQRFDVVADGGRPVGCLLLDRPVVLAATDLVPGDADVRAGQFGQGVALRTFLPHLHEHPRHDAVDGRRVIEPMAGVVVDPAGYGEMFAERMDFGRRQADLGRLLCRCRQADDRGDRDRGRGLPITGGLFFARTAGMVGMAGAAGKMMRGEPPPCQAADCQECQARKPADDARRRRLPGSRPHGRCGGLWPSGGLMGFRGHDRRHDGHRRRRDERAGTGQILHPGGTFCRAHRMPSG